MAWSDLFKFFHWFHFEGMVRALIRRVLGRQENDQSTPQLELPPNDSRDRARSMVMGLQDEICAGA